MKIIRFLETVWYPCIDQWDRQDGTRLEKYNEKHIAENTSQDSLIYMVRVRVHTLSSPNILWNILSKQVKYCKIMKTHFKGSCVNVFSLEKFLVNSPALNRANIYVSALNVPIYTPAHDFESVGSAVQKSSNQPVSTSQLILFIVHEKLVPEI